MVITEKKLIFDKNNLCLCPNWLVKKVRGQSVKNGTEIWLSRIFWLNLPESFGELGQNRWVRSRSNRWVSGQLGRVSLVSWVGSVWSVGLGQSGQLGWVSLVGSNCLGSRVKKCWVSLENAVFCR
jgi:hypothetical protein